VTRRGHGEGSIYRRASDGRWAGVLDLGYVDGKRSRRVVYGRTQREVRDKLTDLRRQSDQGRDLSLPNMTVAQWLDNWIPIKEAEGRRPATIRSYRWLIETHVKPDLGKIRLDKLTPGRVRDHITSKSTSDLSAATVAHILRLLRNTLGEAERLELVSRNVAKAVRMPTVPQFQARGLTVDETKSLLMAIKGHRHEALYATMLVAGLRRGEALGLFWEDIGLDSHVIDVRRSLQRIGQSLQIVEPKTRASHAPIPIPSGLVSILTAHRARQQKERLALGPRWPGLDAVFTSTTGTFVEPRNLSREWANVRAQAGLEGLRMHDLRHSTATVLTSLGIHPRVTMEMLRHADISTTMNVYAHAPSHLQREAANAMQHAIFG
jgi:integrase